MSVPQYIQQPNYGIPQPQLQPQAPKNGLGNASFVLGIIATVFSWIPIAGFIVGLPCALVGLGVGLGGVHLIFKNQSTNKVLTWIGVGLSLLAIVLVIIVQVALVHAVNNS
jgi:cytochrome oxidase assembly protein ShyY1